MAKAESRGTTSARTGPSAAAPIVMIRNATPRRSSWSGGVFTSGLHRATLEREQAARPFLNEQNDEHQQQDLAEHGANHRFEQLVGDAEHHSAEQSAPKIADAAQHHHHEAVD